MNKKLSKYSSEPLVHKKVYFHIKSADIKMDNTSIYVNPYIRSYEEDTPTFEIVSQFYN